MTKLTITRGLIINGRIAVEIPQETTHLDLAHCSSLEVLPQLPEGLQQINLSGCTKLKTITNVPSTVSHLDLRNCSDLEVLPQLPEGLQQLNLSNCSRLTLNDYLVDSLIELKSRNCNITYPSKLSSTIPQILARSRLESVIRGYKQEIPNFNAPKLHELLKRFLTEDVNNRGGIEYLVDSVNGFLVELEKNKSFLPMFEDIATVYLSGCVNQPVFGVLEISALAAIIQAEGIVNKIEYSRQLLSIDQVKLFVATNFTASRVEVEAANALFREVHNKLKNDGILQYSWLGVSRGVQYEDFVRTWVGQNINNATAVVKRSVFDLNHQEIVGEICNSSHCINWGKICLSAELDEIAKEITDQKSQLQQLYLKIEEEMYEEESKDKEDLEKRLNDIDTQIKELDKRFDNELPENIRKISLKKLQEELGIELNTPSTEIRGAEIDSFVQKCRIC